MRFFFLIFLFLMVALLQASNISPQKLKKLNDQAKSIELKKQKLPYYKKKLDSYVLHIAKSWQNSTSTKKKRNC